MGEGAQRTMEMYSPPSFRFRSHQGVCDTPLHLFGWNLGVDGSYVSCVFAHIRAYAIRPYTCSIEIEANYIATKPSNELQRCWYGSHKTIKWTHSALIRMWQNPQTICDDADSGYTKGSNHSVHPQIGLHKRAVAVATTKLRSHSLANAVATVKILHRSLYRR